ncbi:MAG: allophanate hydrolase subunit 1 [Actinobacteria bacterium]|nr:allophanate hydrolase subunit 1 [Actinomycetota bacterium]
MRLLPCGETAVLVETDAVPSVVAVLAGLDAELVPAARTVLVRAASPADLPAVRARVAELLAGPLPPAPVADPAQTVVIGVRYDGEDLAEVAALTGLTAAEVVAAHTGRPWRVAFGGFAPGFAYLDGGDPRLVVPRRADPRTVVPAGAVGLAGSWSGIYPRPSPGGWQLIGRTDAVLWDLGRTPPALLRPGWWVQFEELP